MRILLIALALALLVLSSRGQELNGFGILRSLTPTQVTYVDQSSSGDPGRLVTALRTQETTVENCDPDKIRQGASIALTYTEDSAGVRTAQRIYFYTCREQAMVVGPVVGRTADGIIVRSTYFDAPFPIGTEVTLTSAERVSITTCERQPIVLTEIDNGRMVSSYGEVGDDGTSVVISYLETTDDCPQTSYFAGIIETVTDSSLIVSTESFGVIEPVAPYAADGSGRRDPELIGAVDCAGGYVKWSDLASGDSVQVLMTVYADGRADLGGLQLNKNCPPVPDLGFLELAQGVIVSINDDSVVVRSITGRNVAARLTDETFIGDCTGRPMDVSEVTLGNEAYVSGYRNNGVFVAKYVYEIGDCNSQTIAAVIESAQGDQAVIRTESGRSIVMTIADDVFVTDCSGRERVLTDNRLWERIARITINTSSDPAVIEAASIDVDCPGIVVASGIITRIDDERMVVDTGGFEVEIERPNTYATDINGEIVEWTEIEVDQTVCLQYTYLPNLQLPIYAIVYVGVNCFGEPSTKPIIATGTVTKNENDWITVQTKSSEATFAITDATGLTGAPTIPAVEPGTKVRVSSRERLKSLQPVATMIEVQSTTSVEEETEVEAERLASPNPASAQLEIIVPFTEAVLYSLEGNRMASTVVSTLDVGTLTTGTYVLRLTTPSGQIRSQLVQIVR